VATGISKLFHRQKLLRFSRKKSFLSFRNSAAYTLIEVLVVVVIIGILSAIAFPNISELQAKAEGVVCTGRLRNLWLVFSAQLNDGSTWPQLPANIKVGSVEEQRWWLQTSSNGMGLTQRDWTCPTISRYQHSGTNGQGVSLIDYLPTLFDANPMSPRNWPRVPWFTEMQSVHGEGMLSVRSDGSICPIQDP
jgi:prepilin-type N-terminal cleavage/methylation domain-containing protein